MIVALAGHVDHGKTSIVHALTGVDTDRLAEEKQRGLTIDLGFAYVDIQGSRIGFVDVPGHRRFVHNMVVGVAARQYALLVVAADDGVMPQSREHLQIMRLLGLRHGAVVLNKIDRVPNSRIAQVQRDIRALAAGSFLADAEIVPLSCKAGTGIADLRQHLGCAAASHAATEHDRGSPFRLAVDRAFTVQGSGVVVTGTVVSGQARIDDRLVLANSGAPVRIRGLHVQNAAATSTGAGDRAAVNLAGVDIGAVGRGDWLCEPAARDPISQFALALTMADDFPRSLKHNTPVHVYHAASHSQAHVLLLDSAPLTAGTQAIVDVACHDLLHVKVGDRLVLRDHGLEHTLGGGHVIDCAAAPQRRSRARRERLAAIQIDDPTATLAALARQGPVQTALFAKHWNWTPQDVESAGKRIGLRLLHTHLLNADLAERTGAAIRTTLAEHHRAHPDSAGLAEHDIHASDATKAAKHLLLTTLVQAGTLRLENGRYALAGHQATIPADVLRLFRDVETTLDSLQPPSLGDIAKRLKRPFAAFQRQMRALPAFGLAVRISDNRYYLPNRLLALADIALQLDAAGPFTVRQFRDAAKMGRNAAIEVLEHFDASGFTRRQGDTRKVTGDRASVATPTSAGSNTSVALPHATTRPNRATRQ